VSHDQRLDLVRAAISRGNEVTDSDTRGSSVDISEFNVKMSSLFSNCALPIVPATRVSVSGNVHQMEIESMFFQYVFMQGYNSLPDETNECVPIAQWQNCIYTISGLEHSARNEGKFLFDYITTRQVDCVVSLVRLGWTATDRVETRTLAEYGNKLCNILMPAMSAFSEQPSVVDMDVFNLIVNLHFIISSLFNRLTTDKPHLPSENPYLASLIGLMDELLISVGTVVQIMQYLLCCSADMETDDPSEVPLAMDSTSDVELQEGTALQELWRRVRQYAGCSNDDPPPSPYSLYIGVQEHLFPFLQSTALFFKCLTGINFIHSSGNIISY
jgi:E3 ubiquitin-protein ligase UBR2